MAIKFYRAIELYNTSGRRGIFNVGKTTFYDQIEPRLERVALGPKAVGYTDRSVEVVQAKMIAEAKAKAA